ncbi:MAG: hypothetical protein KGJ90_04330 [Patescibacteria group bacterium]|nr:hypothetical protein [Patescibacteria group bacterium]MDE2011246.1 hypothetical protein [Patescibacteria group bacterium]MDE2233329.1 hypothetical protein [Patescibacteria group bacterium]
MRFDGRAACERGALQACERFARRDRASDKRDRLGGNNPSFDFPIDIRDRENHPELVAEVVINDFLDKLRAIRG